MKLDKAWMTRMEEILRKDEGVRTLPYDCGTGKVMRAPIGKITIGVGRNLQDKGLSDACISLMLQEDIIEAIQGACSTFGSPLFSRASAPRQHALVSLIFQLGIGGVAKFKKTIELVKKEKWAEAASEAKNSLWFTQTPQRAKRVLAMLSDEKYNY